MKTDKNGGNRDNVKIQLTSQYTLKLQNCSDDNYKSKSIISSLSKYL